MPFSKVSTAARRENGAMSRFGQQSEAAHPGHRKSPSSRPRRERKVPLRYTDTSDSFDGQPTAIAYARQQARRLSDSTDSSSGKTGSASSQTRRTSYGMLPDLLSVDASDGRLVRDAWPDATDQAVGRARTAQHRNLYVADLTPAPTTSARDQISRWTRAFNLQRSHEVAARLILDYLSTEPLFAFLSMDDRLRTASAFSLALLLLQWHPGPDKFTKRTGIDWQDVEWSSRVLLTYEETFRSILRGAGVLRDDV